MDHPMKADLIFDDDDSGSDYELESFKQKVQSKLGRQGEKSISDREEEESEESVSDWGEEESEESKSSSEYEIDMESRKEKVKALDSKAETLISSLADIRTPGQSEEESEDDQDANDHEESSDEEQESDHLDEKEKGPFKYSKSNSGDVTSTLPKKAKSPESPKKSQKPSPDRQLIREELRQMSLEEIQKLKERLGLKLFDAVVSEKSVSKKKKKPVFKRENKNRPREMSSKKMVPRFRDVVGVASEQNTKDRAKDKRDPRFDSLCGEFSKKNFRSNYDFVDKIKAKERIKLQEELAEEEDPKRRKKIKYLIQRYDNQERERQRLDERAKAREEERMANRELVQEGLAPRYHESSKAVLKSKELVTQFEKLKQKGSLDKYLKRKNKRLQARDRKRMEEVI